MNSLRPAAQPLAFLGRLRTILGGARYASTEAAVATATPAAVPGAEVTETNPKKQQGKVRRSRAIPPEGHGERFWVFNHIQANYILYSLTPDLKSNKAFRQFPYTGKKLKPAKLRKDYWRPLALVEFGAGKGDVGRSVFQKLRELKKRHELEWEDEELLNMSKRERGKALNDQRGNMVADLAAVLGGRGKGNRIVVQEDEGAEAQPRRREKKKAVVPTEDAVEVTLAKEGEGEGETKIKLHPATVYWANEQDKFYAEKWTENVAHVVGVPHKVRKTEAAAAETEAAAEAEA
ncbi:hypothetical protein VTI74DRAFT_3274 [Chaetomium olivicolor]